MSSYATSQPVAEWVRLFPREVTETYTSSVTFMKQLTVVAVSTITYLKNMFPEDSFTTEVFDGMKLRILKRKCRDELAQFVSTGLIQASEAFEKKFLKKMVLCIYDTECEIENLVEYHIFEYDYTGEGASMNVHSKLRDSRTQTAMYTFEKVRQKTMKLVKACVVVLQACQYEMPETYDVSLRLYYNDDAPEGYQAPGFVPGDELDHFESTLADSMHMGSVHTPYHALTLRTYIKPTDDSSHEAIPSNNAPVMSLNEQEDFETSSAQRSASDDDQIVCPCNKAEHDETHALIRCEYCGLVQHAACFGVRREAAAAAARVPRHCCAACHDADPTRTPTDTRLANMPLIKRECLCVFRRTLEWLSAESVVRARDLMHKFGISSVTACKLMKELQSRDIIEHGPDTDLASPRAVILENVKKTMDKFFQNGEESIVTRLIEETLTPEYQADPVGDVLGLTEKINLQNKAAMCKVVLKPMSKPVVEDATLKQYREAILSNEVVEDGLPLSGSHNPIDVENKTTLKRKGKGGKKTGVDSKKTKNK